MQITGQADVNRNKGEEEMRTAIDKILDACARASSILDRFNDLSHPSADHPPKEKYFVDEILDEALDLMSHQFKVSNTKICRIKNDHVNASISSTALLQVFVNLTINAMHAMGDGGQIDYSVIDNKTYVEVHIHDYGPGIDPKILDSVTEAFFTTKGDMGTGLGLSICKEIIEIEHYGEFKIKNHQSKGLEVIIKIPVNEGDQL
jgi:signal transduction histidine kinase